MHDRRRYRLITWTWTRATTRTTRPPTSRAARSPIRARGTTSTARRPPTPAMVRNYSTSPLQPTECDILNRCRRDKQLPQLPAVQRRARPAQGRSQPAEAVSGRQAHSHGNQTAGHAALSQFVVVTLKTFVLLRSAFSSSRRCKYTLTQGPCSSMRGWGRRVCGTKSSHE